MYSVRPNFLSGVEQLEDLERHGEVGRHVVVPAQLGEGVARDGEPGARQDVDVLPSASCVRTRSRAWGHRVVAYIWNVFVPPSGRITTLRSAASCRRVQIFSGEFIRKVQGLDAVWRRIDREQVIGHGLCRVARFERAPGVAGARHPRPYRRCRTPLPRSLTLASPHSHHAGGCAPVRMGWGSMSCLG